MNLDRMELADLANPVRLARAVISQIPGLTLPVPVDDIAKALDITDIAEMTTEGFEGALLTDDAKSEGIILVKKGMEERRRFTVGHELGHFLCPHHVPTQGAFNCSARDMLASDASMSGRPSWEVEANRFSAELLMPEGMFKRQLRTRRVPDLDLVIRTATLFKVSKLACARRVVDLSDETCAILLSRDGILASAPYRAAAFPYINLKQGMQLPTKSVSRAFQGGDESLSELDESEPSLWTNVSLRGLVIREQVLIQANGYRLTLLVSEVPDLDDEESEVDDIDRLRW